MNVFDRDLGAEREGRLDAKHAHVTDPPGTECAGLADFVRPSYSGHCRSPIHLSWEDSMVRLLALAVAVYCYLQPGLARA